MKSYVWVIFLVILSFVISLYFYPKMPEKMASHWDVKGNVNGYMGKTAALLLIPCILAFLAFLLLIFPAIDPFRENILSFRKYYDNFVLLLILFLLMVHIQMICWNLGLKISPNITFPIGTGILFYYIGIMLEKAKRNYFIGIRTPWTLHDDEIWDKTHQLGAKVFKIAGVISALGVLAPKYAIYFILSILPLSLYLFVYSYLIFRERKSKRVIM
ncbi:MAG: SdpI family protein [bacterium]